MFSTRPSWPRRAMVVVASCLVALVGISAPAANAQQAASAAPRNWTVDVGAQSPDGAIQTMGYYPGHLWIDQGDTVTWVANSLEPHTVTFFSTDSACPATALCALPAGGFDVSDPRQVAIQGGSSYDGHSYYNSGIMTTASAADLPLPPIAVIATSYTLTFPADLAPGTYSYICLLHGMAMQGQITVQNAGAAYPMTPVAVHAQAHRQQISDIADGYRLWAAARVQSADLNRRNGPTVLVGAMDERAMVMRFIPSVTAVPVGSKVTFVANAMDAPHTVTFGDDGTGCGAPPCNPFAPWNVNHDPDGNISANYPGLNGGFTGDPTALNTGVMLVLGIPPSLTGVPAVFNLTVTAPGRYSYFCALHDFMGMDGKLVAVPVGHGA